MIQVYLFSIRSRPCTPFVFVASFLKSFAFSMEVAVSFQTANVLTFSMISEHRLKRNKNNDAQNKLKNKLCTEVKRVSFSGGKGMH